MIGGQFTTEFFFRCFVGLQGLFIIIWIALADDLHSEWYFMFPRMQYDDPDEGQWWVALLFYLSWFPLSL